MPQQLFYRARRSMALAIMLTAASSCAAPATGPRSALATKLAEFHPSVMTADERRASDEHAQILLGVDAIIAPEASGELGVPGIDERITDWSDGSFAREIAAYADAEKKLADLLRIERSESVQIDLQILEDAAGRARRGREIEDRLLVRLYDPGRTSFDGVSALLGDGTSEAQHRSALVRLRRYVEAAGARAPLAQQAEARMREQMNDARKLMPDRASVEHCVKAWPLLVRGLRDSFGNAHVDEAKPLLDRLDSELAAYSAFLEHDVLPRARGDARLPAELYAFRLEERGIDIAPRELSADAHAAFAAIQIEMQTVAREVAHDHGFADPDYRAVLRALKRTQIRKDTLAALYQRRIDENEAILRREQIVSLPARPLGFRMATSAESSRMPAPMYLPAPLLHNEGRFGTFVLVAGDPNSEGTGYDDFSFDAGTWWLTAHEGRPGHDLQFSTMVERPPSIARAVYAFNSVNAEGWGLYAESLIEPFVPTDAKLGILQARLMRAAHAFLDIDLNLGLIEPGEVHRVMVDEVGFSDAWATTCLQRYTTMMPGQAPSYFYGYRRLIELRDDVRRELGDRFEQRAFHDAILSEGLLPPKLMRQAILGHAAR